MQQFKESETVADQSKFSNHSQMVNSSYVKSRFWNIYIQPVFTTGADWNLDIHMYVCSVCISAFDLPAHRS